MCEVDLPGVSEEQVEGGYPQGALIAGQMELGESKASLQENSEEPLHQGARLQRRQPDLV